MADYFFLQIPSSDSKERFCLVLRKYSHNTLGMRDKERAAKKGADALSLVWKSVYEIIMEIASASPLSRLRAHLSFPSNCFHRTDDITKTKIQNLYLAATAFRFYSCEGEMKYT